MKCQTYIFQLTSGQLDAAGWPLRLQAAQHRLMCRHCRAFTRNDAQLMCILNDFREHLTTQALPSSPGSDPPPDAPSVASSGP